MDTPARPGVPALSEAQQDDADSSTKALPVRLPFTYAKRHGVVVSELDNTAARVLCRPGVTQPILSEVRRYLGRPLAVKFLAPEKFDQVLQTSYQRDSAQTMQMIGEVGDELADL